MAESINRVLAQPKQRPTLANLKRVCPQDLAHCEGYVWHLGSRVGKGSFGEVFLGWTSNGALEVAVKVVRKEFFKQDPKVRENLEREIRILKLLRGCEYVVHLRHVQEMKQHIVLVMELCDFDLDHLVKVKPFKEQDIIIFLYQLAQGMKALREQNIVHRDLKPGNILIKKHPTTGKMMIKLADFGFARHFKDEGMKPIDMTSLAGTPVFMAPEALRCVFHPGEHYDDKVDIWSIGSLLYKVIVGTCGFYAQLQDIPRILKHKGDAIAFERVPHSRKINYISELPPVVNDRLSEPFREKMNNLLRGMLKLDSTERMTFTEFYNAVDDIITSKIEVINLLHGTSMKVMNDPNLTVEDLTNEIHSHSHVPPNCQILFSNNSQFFIAAHIPLSPQNFSQLLEDAGGMRGHAKIYLLPVNHLEKDKLVPDFSCLAGLGFVIEDRDLCVSQIIDHKLSDEMVHMINYMSAQQKAQLEGMEELCKFATREVTLFGSHGYKQLTELGHQALAKANLAIQWLQQDIGSLSDKSQGQLGALLQNVEQHKANIQQLVLELGAFNGTADLSVKFDLKEDDLVKAATTLSDESKKLPKLRKDQIYGSCKSINEDCQKLIVEVTEKVKVQLRPLFQRLSHVWTLSQKSENLRRNCAGLDVVLAQVSQERTLVLRSISGSTPMRSPLVQNTPPVLVTPPSGHSQFPGPPPSLNTWGQQPTTPNVEAIKKENEDLQTQVERLTTELNTLKISGRKRNSSSGADEEQTIRPGAVGNLRPHSPSDVESTMKPSSGFAEMDSATLQTLTGQLQNFCTTAEKLRPGITGNTSPRLNPSKNHGGSGNIYPSLLDDYSVISMKDAKPTTASPSTIPPDNLGALLPHALQLSELLHANMASLESMVKMSARGTVTVSDSGGLIKIARPMEYEEGDIVIFHQVRLTKSKASVPTLLHLEKPHPYILMDNTSFNNFNIRPGKMPELILGRLTEKPRRLRFEDNTSIAEEIGISSGEFFKVKAESTVLKFSAPRAASRTVPSRPPPPAAERPSSSSSDSKKRHGSSSGLLGKFGHKKGGFV